MPFSQDIDDDYLRTWGCYISEITFQTTDLSKIIEQCDSFNVPYDYEDDGYIRLIPDAEPMAIYVEESDNVDQHLPATHPNNVYRIDWLLLSASDDVRSFLSDIFDCASSGRYKISGYDVWRIGTDSNPSFVRFEPSRLYPSLPENFLLLEAPNIYFAY